MDKHDVQGVDAEQDFVLVAGGGIVVGDGVDAIAAVEDVVVTNRQYSVPLQSWEII